MSEYLDQIDAILQSNKALIDTFTVMYPVFEHFIRTRKTTEERASFCTLFYPYLEKHDAMKGKICELIEQIQPTKDKAIVDRYNAYHKYTDFDLMLYDYAYKFE
jgi:hypothetical protein